MINNLAIFGITGTNGAGKGAVVDILKENGFSHLSASGYLMEEVKKVGWEENRESLIRMGNELRAKFGPGIIAERLYDKAGEIGGEVIIESIRTEGEIDALKAKGKFILIGVTADRKIRYDRVSSRAGIKDSISFEEFCRSEDIEMVSTDPNKQNLGRCIQLADFVIENNGNLDELKIKVNQFINNL